MRQKWESDLHTRFALYPGKYRELPPSCCQSLVWPQELLVKLCGRLGISPYGPAIWLNLKLKLGDMFTLFLVTLELWSPRIGASGLQLSCLPMKPSRCPLYCLTAAFCRSRSDISVRDNWYCVFHRSWLCWPWPCALLDHTVSLGSLRWSFGVLITLTVSLQYFVIKKSEKTRHRICFTG